MTPEDYWYGWYLWSALGTVILYWVIRLAMRHERRRNRFFD